MKRISADAYQALRDALAVITWNKRPFESYVRTALRDHPELVAGLPFAEPKRVVADVLVDRLVAAEDKYQATTLSLMLEVARLESFPNIEQIKDDADRAIRLEDARRAIERLAKLTEPYSELATAQERLRAEQVAADAQREAQRRFADEIERIRVRFMSLYEEADHRLRGEKFERLLTDYFALYDMEPRLSYVTGNEQIDGSLSFDTDDYIVEARWRAEPVDRADADVFATKVRRKGKNAVGLFVSVMGFTSVALKQYRESTPFITIDGTDLYATLEQRVRLDDLMKAKKRHANETGDCFLPASRMG